jgi:hypothetical protein
VDQQVEVGQQVVVHLVVDRVQEKIKASQRKVAGMGESNEIL